MKEVVSILNSQIKDYINKIKDLEDRLKVAEKCINSAKKECFLECERAYSELSKYTNMYGSGKDEVS